MTGRWEDRAACKTTHGGLHEDAYIEPATEKGGWKQNTDRKARFIARCRTSCPVRAECLEAALAYETAPHTGLPLKSEQRHGIWGGYLPKTRERIAYDRRNNECRNETQDALDALTASRRNATPTASE